MHGVGSDQENPEDETDYPWVPIGPKLKDELSSGQVRRD
jgi:hypothetical protein